MKINWGKIGTIFAKAAEVAGPLLAQKKPTAGAILTKSGEIVGQQVSKEPKK